MNFDLTDDQKMLVETAASFAKKESPVERMRKLRDDDTGWEKKVWKEMGELGWLGILYPEDLGGFGGRFADAALVIEQFGKTLVPEPYIAAAVVAGGAILRAGNDEQKKRWLEPLIAGDVSYALAWAERQGRYDAAAVATRAARDGEGWRLSGEKVWVENGHAADALVVSARTDDGLALFVVEPGAGGVEVTPVDTMDGRRAAMVRLDGAAVGGDALLGEPGSGLDVLETVLDHGAAAACAEGVGIARTVLDMTVEYLKTREQFGVRIGAFQALQHRAVDMFIKSQLLESMSIWASIRADEDDAVERRRATSAAMVELCTSGRWVVRQGIQLHGGIGVTDEHDVGLFFKRLRVLGALYGDEDYHLRRYSSLPTFTEQ